RRGAGGGGGVVRCGLGVCGGALGSNVRFLREGGSTGHGMVRVKENGPIDSAIRRFKKQCEKAGVLKELRKREHYEKPSVRRKKKAIAARQRAIRRTARNPSHDHRSLTARWGRVGDHAGHARIPSWPGAPPDPP